MTNNFEIRPIPQDQSIIEAAFANPGGYVYDVDWDYPSSSFTPPEAIRGAWEVDKTGRLTGKYLNNDVYRPVEICERILPDYVFNGLKGTRDDWFIEIGPGYEEMFPAVPEEGQVGYWYIDKEGNFTKLFRPNSKYVPKNA